MKQLLQATVKAEVLANLPGWTAIVGFMIRAPLVGLWVKTRGTSMGLVGVGPVFSSFQQGDSDIGPLRILVVDDDEIERWMILRFFSRVEGPPELVVEEAESGEQAVERLRAQHFDLVLTDYRMGALSGVDVLAVAMNESPTTIRILISGFASPDLAKEAVDAGGAHAVLEKPMTAPELHLLLDEQVVQRFLMPLERP